MFEQLKENEGGYGKVGLKFKTPTASEMREFRQSWNLKVQEMRRRKIMALAVSLVVAIGLLYGLVTLITQSL